MKTKLFYFAFLAIICFIMLQSCTNEPEFMKTGQLNSKSISNVGLVSNSVKRKLSLDWNKRGEVKEGRSTYIIIPIIDTGNRLQDNVLMGDRFLVTKWSPTEKTEINIVELISLETLPNNTERSILVIDALKALKGKSNTKVSNFNGWAFLYSSEYKHISGKAFNNGEAKQGNLRLKVLRQRKKISSESQLSRQDLNSPRIQSTLASTTSCNTGSGWYVDCTRWYMAPENGGAYLGETCGEPYYDGSVDDVIKDHGSGGSEEFPEYDYDTAIYGQAPSNNSPELDVSQIPGYNLLTNAEKEILGYNPANYFIYLINAIQATKYREGFYGPDVDGDRGNAFKHAYFIALNALSFSYEMAEQLGFAHEYKWNDLPTDMDLHNNRIGLDIYTTFMSHPSYYTNPDMLHTLVIDAVNRGDLKYINDEGVLVPTNR